MDILLHSCCAPCAVACVDSLRGEGVEPVAYWYNPNIHPFTEYRARRDCFRDFAEQSALRLVEEDDYGLRGFLPRLEGEYTFGERCGVCYAMRFDSAAKKAKELGLPAFCSTLFISPYQDHELMLKVAGRAAEKYGVDFLHRDFRPLFREGQQTARERGFYMQKYCGCVFSEEERYLKKKFKNISG